MNEDGFGDLLRRIGLGETDIDTYRTVLEEGESKVSAIVEKAEVSRRHAYTVIERLEDAGLVEKNDSVTPAIVRPSPPELVYQRRNETLIQLRDEIEVRYDRDLTDTFDFEVLTSREAVVNRLRSVIRAGTDLVVLSVSPPVLTMLTDDLADAVDRGALVLVIICEIDQLDTRNISPGSFAHAVRVQWGKMPQILSVDQTHSVISDKGAITKPRLDRHAVSFNEPHLSGTAFSSFLHDWRLCEEVYVKAPDDLPMTFSNFNFALLEASVHVRNGERVRAKIEARPVKHGRRNENHGEPELIKGEVVDIRQLFIDPMTSTRNERHLIIETDDDEIVSVGGVGAFFEDYEALTTKLDRV